MLPLVVLVLLYVMDDVEGGKVRQGQLLAQGHVRSHLALERRLPQCASKRL